MEATVLRTVKMGGFNKEDVLQYVDELNSKIVALEDEARELRNANPADPKELQRYQQQLDNMQKKLNESNNALRKAKAENEELKKQLAAKPGEGGGATVGLSKEDAAELAQLKEAYAKAKGDVDKLTQQLAQAQSQIKEVQEQAAKQIESAVAVAAKSGTAGAADSAANSAELLKIKSQLVATTNELKIKAEALANVETELHKQARIVSEKETELRRKEAEIGRLSGEIGTLTSEIAELRENESTGIPPSFDMGALFTEAQKTARKITIEAKVSADKTTKDAKDQARAMIDEATAEAQKTIDSAAIIAETHIKEAKEKARADFYESYRRAESVNAASETIKDMLSKEIEDISVKLTDISSLIEKVTNQASVRMNDAKGILEEAKKVINSKKKVDVGTLGSPPDIINPLPKPTIPTPVIGSIEKAGYTSNDAQRSSTVSSPAQSGTMSFNDSAAFSYNSSKPEQRTAPRAAQPERTPVKQAPFNFDMSELLKQAEEEASKDDQG